MNVSGDNKYNCPNCGSDNTASIPLVYSRGHATGTATHTEIVGYDVEKTKTTYADGHSETKETNRTPIYGDVTYPTYTITDLAREVAPPEEPKKPTPEEFGCFLNGMIGCISVYISAKIVDFIYNLVQNIFGGIGFFIGIVLVLVLSLILYGLLGGLVYTISGRGRRHEQNLQIYEQEMQTYRAKYAEWEHSYICMRCGHRFYID